MRREYRVHPTIGIARVGNSPDDYFIGPEAPGVPPSLDKPDALPSPNSTYKDKDKFIKRQGARFRIYEYTFKDANAPPQVREITSAEAQIEWEVHLQNRKAAAPKFKVTPTDPDGRRNEGVPEGQVIIDAGRQKISGVGLGMKRLKGSFQGSSNHAVQVPLGDLLTDSAGRLIVLGGFGTSQSVPPGRSLDDFANNDGWCDDVSDGPVRATIQLKGSTKPIEVDSSWVIVAPPDFAPPIENVITLYDVVYNMMASPGFDPSLAVSKVTKISFTRDVYPILRRVSNMHWVSKVGDDGHGPNSNMHFISRLPQLSSNESGDSLRKFIFNKLRNPAGGGGNMPKMPASIDENQAINATVALTAVQYERMRRWAEGEFIADWKGQEPAPRGLDKLRAVERPHALDRAALEACVGGGFFPGIEVGQIMLKPDTYDKKRPFRINAQLFPGMLTAGMAVPWQADFFYCAFQPDEPANPQNGMDWWPGQRPVNVWRDDKREQWVPAVWEKPERMVDEWWKLGLVVKNKVAGKDYVEDERHLPDVVT